MSRAVLGMAVPSGCGLRHGLTPARIAALAATRGKAAAKAAQMAARERQQAAVEAAAAANK